MHSKRDQVQAHLFIMGRLASAMLRTEPDAPESPLGRTNRGAAIGVIIAVLVCAGAFVFGLIRPGGNDSWRSGENLVVDKQTGARYLYLDGRLRPVRNYASARLVTGGDLGVTTVGTSSLAGTPHGSPVGIPDGPEALPGTGDLDRTPWLVCSGVLPRTTGVVATTTTLALGADAPEDVPGGRRLGGGEGMLVAGPDDATYLLWQGSRLRVDERAKAAEALGYGDVTPRPVSAAFLDAFPLGPDLAPAEVPGRGEKGPELAGRSTRVGQLFKVDVPGSPPRYHLLTREGLVPLTDTGAALLLGDERTREKAYGGAAAAVTTLGADTLAGHLAPDARGSGAADLPATPPEAVTTPTGSVACAEVDSADSGVRVGTSVLPEAALPEPVQPPAPEVEPGCLKVDSIAVRTGKGALVRASSASGSALGDTTYLVTDEGVKYRLLSQEAVKALGYEGLRARTMPSPMLAMLPSGPDLTPEAASAGEARVTTRCSGRPGP
ncbi:putative membrane protein [Streptomyces ambofaciens ATCC 23877]|uniref:Putative membrane protein n=1 Tax=Streptomyces ambofaciens (strain ATCC 23877 / 3486 / DSM 40053 / JCM 4204 / NBRC 12836 / NRRL B-2516) TaxID=278992 RepID=A3KJT0_STRA7|nr:type VII secretion protein EccB [Streptomyces ambofaciens]AKZ54119.1 putative membrane protein [Streptomyces ambofaciens ATCC 23877]CAJ89965.1 putative membrane protein [Streptomyces ambofaciens ATCC 23877]